MASHSARKQAIQRASKQASTGSVWVRRAADGKTAVRPAQGGGSRKKK